MKYLLFFSLFNLSCSKYSGPYRICLKSHNSTYIQMVQSGGILTPITQHINICDEYSIQEYIKINKTVYEVQKVFEGKE